MPNTAKILPRESIEKPGAFGVREGHSHSRHEGWVQNHRRHLIPRGQVNGRHGADALAVEDDIFWRDAVPGINQQKTLGVKNCPCLLDNLCSPGSKCLPGSVDVSVQVLLRGLARADPVAWIVVAEDVAVDPRAEPQVEAAHLTQVDGVSVWEEDGEARVGRAPHEYARHPVASGRPAVEALNVFLLSLRVLPLGALRKG